MRTNAIEIVRTLPIGTTFVHNGDKVTLRGRHGIGPDGKLLITADTPTGRERFNIWPTDNVKV